MISDPFVINGLYHHFLYLPNFSHTAGIGIDIMSEYILFPNDLIGLSLLSFACSCTYFTAFCNESLVIHASSLNATIVGLRSHFQCHDHGSLIHLAIWQADISALNILAMNFSIPTIWSSNHDVRSDSLITQYR